MVPRQRPLRGKRQIIALFGQIQNMCPRRAVQKPPGRENDGGAARMQTGLLRRTISPHCPAGAKRIIRTRNQPPGGLRERAPALRQLARADDGYAARGKQRRIALREQHCRAALAQRLPQPRGIAC